MKANEPGDLPRLFLQALNSGDVDAVVSLYEPTGMIAPDPKQVVMGHAAIRAMVSGFLAEKHHFVLHDSEVVQTGDVALVRSLGTVTRMDPSGKQSEMNVGPTLVVRRSADGRWLVAIDRP